MAEFKEIIQEKIAPIMEFLQDPQRPAWQRYGAPGFGFLLLVTLFSTCGGEQDTGIVTNPDEIMGFGDIEGDSGLGDEASQQEKLLAQMPQEEENAFDIRDLDLDDDESEQDILEIRKQRQAELNPQEVPKKKTSLKTPFSNLAKIIPNPTTIAEASDGTIWVTDEKKLVSLTNKLEIKPETILDQRLFDSTFNEDMSPITALHLSPDGAVWIGLQRGEVAKYYRYSWQLLTRASEPISGKIYDITTFNNATFFAGVGSWRWDGNYQRAVRAETPQSTRFTSFLNATNDTLYASTNDGIWVFDQAEYSWARLWKTLRTDGAVHCLTERKDGTLLAGTSNGIIEISKRGIVTDRLLAGEVVTSIAEDKKGNLFVATRQHGLFYWNGIAWFRAGRDHGLINSIDSLFLDSTGRFWLSSSRQGLFVAATARVRRWIQDFPEAIAGTQFSEPKVFPTACDAASVALKGIMLSRDIAIEVLDGVQHVFFKGKQVCPKGDGYRRPDGLTVTQQGWRATIYRERAREQIDIPKEFAADKNSAMLLDSQARLWIGTSDSGLYLYSKKKWSRIGVDEFQKSGILKIFEDSRGRIWIAGNPSFDRPNQRFAGEPLTLIEGDTIRGFSPRVNFGSWQANDITEISKDKMLVATQNGFTILHDDGQMINFGEHEKIKPVFMYSVSLDDAGSAWFSHQFFGDGITWFDGKSLRSVNSKAGLFDEKINNIAHDRQGRVWLISTAGRVGIYPREHLVKLATINTLPKRKQLSLKK